MPVLNGILDELYSEAQDSALYIYNAVAAACIQGDKFTTVKSVQFEQFIYGFQNCTNWECFVSKVYHPRSTEIGPVRISI